MKQIEELQSRIVLLERERDEAQAKCAEKDATLSVILNKAEAQLWYDSRSRNADNIKHLRNLLSDNCGKALLEKVEKLRSAISDESTKCILDGNHSWIGDTCGKCGVAWNIFAEREIEKLNTARKALEETK